MKYCVVLLAICWPIDKTSAQSMAFDGLLNLKCLFEFHFTGTNIRDVAVEFRLKRDSASSRYTLTGSVAQLAEPTSIEGFLRKLDTLSISADPSGYAGTNCLGDTVLRLSIMARIKRPGNSLRT